MKQVLQQYRFVCLWFKLLDFHSLGRAPLCFSFGDDPLRLDLCHQLRFDLLLLLLRRVLHSFLSGVDASAVCLVLEVRAKDPIPPAERGGEVVCESHVVEIVVLGTRPEGQNVLE